MKKIGVYLKWRWRQLQNWLYVNTKYVKMMVSIYPGIAALFLAFFKDPIVISTRNGMRYFKSIHTYHDYTINWWVSVYWIVLLIWLYLYFRYVTNESSATQKNNEGIRSAIFRSPNPRVYLEYKSYYKRIMDLLGGIKEDDIKTFNVNFSTILENICLLTTSYINQKDDDTIYGANIMLYFPYSRNKDIISKYRANTDEWIHCQDTELDKFVGVLHLMDDLVYSANKVDVVDGANRPSITLPVRFEQEDSDLSSINIPGAPRAAVAEIFLFSDVKDTSAYHHLGKVETKAAEQYWKNTLPELGSLFSFAIPFQWDELKAVDNEVLDIIGVLNIDSTKKDILGTDIEYHTTFISLMYPILCQMGPYLRKYYELYQAEIVKSETMREE